MQDHAVVNIT